MNKQDGYKPTLATECGSATKQQSIEAAWRIWKAEVSEYHMPINSVTQMAEIIDSIYRPKEHLCSAEVDLIGVCTVCGKSVL